MTKRGESLSIVCHFNRYHVSKWTKGGGLGGGGGREELEEKGWNVSCPNFSALTHRHLHTLLCLPAWTKLSGFSLEKEYKNLKIYVGTVLILYIYLYLYIAIKVYYTIALLGMGRVRFSALGSGFGLWDLTRVGSRVNEFWFGFIKLCSGQVFSHFFNQFWLNLDTFMEKNIFGLVKKIFRVARVHKKMARVGFWPNPSLTLMKRKT